MVVVVIPLKLNHCHGPVVDDVGPAGLVGQVGSGVVEGSAGMDGAAPGLQGLGDSVSL